MSISQAATAAAGAELLPAPAISKIFFRPSKAFSCPDAPGRVCFSDEAKQWSTYVPSPWPLKGDLLPAAVWLAAPVTVIRTTITSTSTLPPQHTAGNKCHKGRNSKKNSSLSSLLWTVSGRPVHTETWKLSRASVRKIKAWSIDRMVGDTAPCSGLRSIIVQQLHHTSLTREQLSMHR